MSDETPAASITQALTMTDYTKRLNLALNDAMIDHIGIVDPPQHVIDEAQNKLNTCLDSMRKSAFKDFFEHHELYVGLNDRKQLAVMLTVHF